MTRGTRAVQKARATLHAATPSTAYLHVAAQVSRCRAVLALKVGVCGATLLRQAPASSTITQVGINSSIKGLGSVTPVGHTASVAGRHVILAVGAALQAHASSILVGAVDLCSSSGCS
jgi:hypothetical protein